MPIGGAAPGAAAAEGAGAAPVGGAAKPPKAPEEDSCGVLVECDNTGVEAAELELLSGGGAAGFLTMARISSSVAPYVD